MSMPLHPPTVLQAGPALLLLSEHADRQIAAVRRTINHPSGWASPRPSRSAPRCLRTPSYPPSPTWLQMMVMMVGMTMDAQYIEEESTSIFKNAEKNDANNCCGLLKKQDKSFTASQGRWDNIKRGRAAPQTISTSSILSRPPSLFLSPHGFRFVRGDYSTPHMPAAV